MIVMQDYSVMMVCGIIMHTITFHGGMKTSICRHLVVNRALPVPAADTFPNTTYFSKSPLIMP